MIRSPAGFDGETRIKRYQDYYQASYGVMMLSSGQFGAGTAAGYLLGAEPSGYATDFTAGGVQGNALVRSFPRNTQMDYSGTPFLAQGGPVTFSRGSLATVTDSDGLIKWAPHNLLLASEQFDNSNWTKSSATVTANAVAAPNGTTTADTITASGANGTALQSYTAIAVPYVFGVWLKRKTGTGNIQIAADSGTYTTVTITNDWALYTVTQTPAAGTISAGIRIVTSGDAVEVWGAHLYRSDLGGMQANASAYPTYNPSTPKNLLGFTELLTTGWTNTNTTDSQVAIAAPNGSANSIDVAATAGNGTLLASLSLLASPYTFSIWLRRKTGTGTIEITVDGTTYVTATVTADWQRFSTTLTPSAGTRTPGIRIVTSGDAVYAWGAQLSDSASLDPYVPNFGAAPSAAAAYGPRLDYDPVTLAARGLLVEEQRTNLLLRSAEFDNTGAWFASNVTVTANNVTAPDGSMTADRLVYVSSGGLILQDYSTTTSGAYTGSIYLRADSATTVRLRVQQSGGVLQELTCSVTTSWQRFNVSLTSVSPTFIRFAVLANSNTPTVYAWGAQLEAGSFATSYIPTTTASVTRSADVASAGTSVFPYSATEWTLIAAYMPFTTSGSNRGVWALTDGTNNNTADWRPNGGNFTMSSGGVGQVDLYPGGVPVNTIGKGAMAAKLNDVAVCRNGGTVLTDTSATMPVGINQLQIGYLANSSTFAICGHIRQITYIPRRLTNAELQARTAA